VPEVRSLAPAFRPADQGDTAALSTTEEVCSSRAIFGAFTTFLSRRRSTSRQRSGLRRLSRRFSRPALPDLAGNQKSENPQIRNPHAHFTPIVPHFFALYRETKFFFSPLSCAFVCELKQRAFICGFTGASRHSNARPLMLFAALPLL
jgi:hypothetical protein